MLVWVLLSNVATCQSSQARIQQDIHIYVQGAEEFFMFAATPDHTVRTFLATFATGKYNAYKDQEGGDPDDADAAGNNLDELGFEEAQEYRRRVTKWIRGSLEALQDVLFWFLMAASHMSRSPIRHMFGILSKYSGSMSARVRDPYAKDCESHELPIVDFVTVRVQQLDQEFVELRNNVPSWTRKTFEMLKAMICWSRDNSLELNDMECMATQLVLLNHASFKRRVFNLFSQILAASLSKLMCQMLEAITSRGCNIS